MARPRRTAKDMEVIREAIIQILDQSGIAMTLRQVYYQLVAVHIIDNNRNEYCQLSRWVVDMRRSGAIPWSSIEDRMRKARQVSMYDDLADFATYIKYYYQRDVWNTQPEYVELWLEKDALSGIFDAVRRPYGVTLNVGRGYDGWDSIHAAAERYAKTDKPVTVLYFGDFDPSGEDMVRSLRERLGDLGARPNLIKCALTAEDIERYKLPPDFTKVTDTRSAKFIKKHGDVAVELDALSVAVLRNRIKSEIESHMDLDALAETQRIQKTEVSRLVELAGQLAS